MARKTFLCKTKRPGAYGYEGIKRSPEAGEIFVVKTDSSYPSQQDIQKQLPGHITMWMGSGDLRSNSYWEVTEMKDR